MSEFTPKFQMLLFRPESILTHIFVVIIPMLKRQSMLFVSFGFWGFSVCRKSRLSSGFYDKDHFIKLRTSRNRPLRRKVLYKSPWPYLDLNMQDNPKKTFCLKLVQQKHFCLFIALALLIGPKVHFLLIDWVPEAWILLMVSQYSSARVWVSDFAVSC